MLAFVGLASLGCGDGRIQPASSARDSAGVRIVENRTPVWGEDEQWLLSTEPALRIGVLDGDAAYQLFGIVGATRLTDGRIVVANAGTSELRFFDSTGRHLASVGHQGEGPGEFRSLARLWRGNHDSLYTWDRELGRLSVFDSAGRFARTMRLEVPSGRIAQQVVGQLADGSLVAIGSSGSFLRAEAGRVATDTAFFSRFAATGTFLTAFRSVPGVAWYGFGAGEQHSFWMVPFTPGPRWAVAGDRLYLGTGSTPRVEAWSSEGALQQIVSGPDGGSPVESVDVRRYGDELLALAGDDNERRQIERFISDVPFPGRLPAFRALRADALGYLWVERFRRPGESQPEWLVFEPEGRWLRTVETPLGLRVTEIGAEYVLGIDRDELDVERVLLYELAR